MANGNFGGGNGTYENPFLVEDDLDLIAIGKNFRDNTNNKYYKQTSDIDLKKYNEGEGFSPISLMATLDSVSYDDYNNDESTKKETNFSYDGNGFKILNLYQDRNDEYSGLFKINGFANAGRSFAYDFKNIKIINANISGQSAGFLFSEEKTAYSSGNNTTILIRVINSFFSGKLNVIVNKNINKSSEFFNCGISGYMDNFNSGDYYSLLPCFRLYNNVMVADIKITNNIKNSNFKCSLLAGNCISSSYVMTESNSIYTYVKNNAIHANISVEKIDESAIVNIYGIKNKFWEKEKKEKNSIKNTYVNISLTSNIEKGTNLYYFMEDKTFLSNLIANHTKGKAVGYEFDNKHFLTDEQMKDLSYYKALGWDVYE